MWLGRSSPSCTISSARSVSQAAMPCAASASLSPISWVAIDLTLTTSSMPWRLGDVGDERARLVGVARPVHGRPAGGERGLEGEQVLVEVGEGGVLDRGARCRSSSQSSTSATTPARLARIVPVAWARLRRSWVSASAARAASGNAGMPTKVACSVVMTGHLRGVVGGARPAPPPGASCGRRPAAATAARRRASGTSCPRRPAPPRRSSARAGLVGAHRHRGVGVLHREGAAEAAALLGPGQLPRSIPRTARSSRVGRSPTRSIRSEWQVGW